MGVFPELPRIRPPAPLRPSELHCAPPLRAALPTVCCSAGPMKHLSLRDSRLCASMGGGSGAAMRLASASLML